MKKCPFCGSKARMVENHDWGTVYIRCDDEFGTCSILPCTEDSYHPHEAEKEWNTRATEAEIRAKVIEEYAEKVSVEISESIIWGMLPVDCKDGVSDEIADYVIETVKKIARELKESSE